MRWKIDENKELPLAIIEDTEDGNGIAEIGERTERNLAIAAEIVESHNLATPASTGEANGTRFQEFDDADHPCQKWWNEHGQYMMSGGGRREFIWACRGWIAHEQLAEGVEVTGESIRELPPAPTSVPQAEPPKNKEEYK